MLEYTKPVLRLEIIRLYIQLNTLIIDLQIAKDRLIEQLDNYFYGECDQSQKYNNYSHEKQLELA